jgi:hypothetical protein
MTGDVRDEAVREVSPVAAPTVVDRFQTSSIIALIVTTAGALWLRPITSSLWVDETITWWIIKDSLADVFHRAYTYQGQSVFYYPFEWLVRHVGHAESLH